jgi:hypothetical protein
MLGHYSIYRGYSIGLERQHLVHYCLPEDTRPASPKTPDLPILRCYCTKALLKSEAADIPEAKPRVDKILAS